MHFCFFGVFFFFFFFFLWSAGLKTLELCKRMSTQYGEHCMAHKNVHKWVDRFKCGRTTPNDEQ